MTSFFPANIKKILLSPKERRILIRKLQNEIERLEQWYFDRESRIKGDIIVFDTDNEYSSPKIMTLKERERVFVEKRTRIQQQLESLKWKQRFCTECNKYKNQEEFRTRESICRDCYSTTLRAKREEIMKRRENNRSINNKL
jgi:hypothetical protein